jgi:hypothetical protein
MSSSICIAPHVARVSAAASGPAARRSVRCSTAGRPPPSPRNGSSSRSARIAAAASLGASGERPSALPGRGNDAVGVATGGGGGGGGRRGGGGGGDGGDGDGEDEGEGRGGSMRWGAAGLALALVAHARPASAGTLFAKKQPTIQVGPGRYCSPRRRKPFNSRNEG